MTYESEKMVCELKLKIDNEIEDFIVRAVEQYGNNQEITVNAKKIFEALMKAEKYKWHDLRKNPNDLPKEDEEVIVENIHEHQHIAWIYAGYWAYIGGNLGDTVIAWRKIEPFEGEENEILL